MPARPDGWLRMTGGDLSRPLARPTGGAAPPHGLAPSDDFSAPLALGSTWPRSRPEPGEARVADGALRFAGKGEAPGDAGSAPDRHASAHARHPIGAIMDLRSGFFPIVPSVQQNSLILAKNYIELQ